MRIVLAGVVSVGLAVLATWPCAVLASPGILGDWDRTNDLKDITVPTLVIGAQYDTMDPAFMRKMSTLLPNGQFLLAPNGSHMALYDDQQVYMDGLIRFLRGVQADTP